MGVQRLKVTSGQRWSADDRVCYGDVDGGDAATDACYDGPNEAPAAESEDLLSHLAQLTRLQHLYFKVPVLNADAGGVASLAPLTQLTTLHIISWWRSLCSAEDVAAFAVMRHMRSLCVVDFVLPRRCHLACMHVLGALPALEELALCPTHYTGRFGNRVPSLAPGSTDDMGVVQAFSGPMPDRPFPSLRWTIFKVEPRSPGVRSGEAAIRTLADFPALQEVWLQENGRMLDIKPQNQEYSGSFRERLDRIAQASASGFRIITGMGSDVSKLVPWKLTD